METEFALGSRDMRITESQIINAICVLTISILEYFLNRALYRG